MGTVKKIDTKEGKKGVESGITTPNRDCVNEWKTPKKVGNSKVIRSLEVIEQASVQNTFKILQEHGKDVEKCNLSFEGEDGLHQHT
ncbi:hypothetical protein CsatB_022004 [Cannabis sativa]